MDSASVLIARRLVDSRLCFRLWNWIVIVGLFIIKLLSLLSQVKVTNYIWMGHAANKFNMSVRWVYRVVFPFKTVFVLFLKYCNSSHIDSYSNEKIGWEWGQHECCYWSRNRMLKCYVHCYIHWYWCWHWINSFTFIILSLSDNELIA